MDRQSSTGHRRSFGPPADPAGLVDPATPVGLVAPATPVGLVDPATPVGLVDPAGRATVVDPGDMNRVAAATMAPAAAMAPVARVGMVRVVPVGTIRVDPEGRLRAPNPVVRVEPGNRAATDLRMGRAPLGRKPVRPVRMPTRLHLPAERPLLMPALPRLTRADRRTPADRRRDPTTRAVVTCQEAVRAVMTGSPLTQFWPDLQQSP